jgi:hypothetical protein
VINCCEEKLPSDYIFQLKLRSHLVVGGIVGLKNVFEKLSHSYCFVLIIGSPRSSGT